MSKGSGRRPCQINRSEYNSRWDATFPVQTPSDTRITLLNSLRIDGEARVSGLRTVDDCEGELISVDTGSGGVEVNNVECKKLNVDTGSGGVDCRGVSADSARLDTGSGGVDLYLDHMGSLLDWSHNNRSCTNPNTTPTHCHSSPHIHRGLSRAGNSRLRW